MIYAEFARLLRTTIKPNAMTEGAGAWPCYFSLPRVYTLGQSGTVSFRLSEHWRTQYKCLYQAWKSLPSFLFSGPFATRNSWGTPRISRRIMIGKLSSRWVLVLEPKSTHLRPNGVAVLIIPRHGMVKQSNFRTPLSCHLPISKFNGRPTKRSSIMGSKSHLVCSLQVFPVSPGRPLFSWKLALTALSKLKDILPTFFKPSHSFPKKPIK